MLTIQEIKLVLEARGKLTYNRLTRKWQVWNSTGQHRGDVTASQATELLNAKFVKKVWAGEAVNIFAKADIQLVEPLTKQQLDNWRNLVYQMAGASAAVLTDEDLERIHRNTQLELDASGALQSSTFADYARVA